MQHTLEMESAASIAACEVAQFEEIGGNGAISSDTDDELHEAIVARKKRKVEQQKLTREHSRQIDRFYSFLPVQGQHDRLYTLFRRAVLWTPALHRSLRRFCSIARRTRIQSNVDRKRLQFSLQTLLTEIGRAHV